MCLIILNLDLGDEHLKPYVIAQAEVTVIERSDLDEFIILASDGLWDVMSNEEACKVVRFSLKRKSEEEMKKSIVITEENETKSRAAVAALNLKRIAMKRGSQDNISVIVIDLNKLSKTSA